MYKIDVSEISVLDYRDYILHKCRTGASEVSDFIKTPNQAFLLGAYYNDWEPVFDLPYKLTQFVRHAAEKIEPLKSQMEFLCKEYTDSKPNQSFDYIEYTEYELNNLILTDKQEDLIYPLCIYLGQQYGRMYEIGFLQQLQHTVVFVRTASGPQFIGIVRVLDLDQTVLTKAHELNSDEFSLTPTLQNFKVLGPEIPFIIIHDAVEIRPCSMIQMKKFVEETGYNTYGIQLDNKDEIPNQ